MASLYRFPALFMALLAAAGAPALAAAPDCDVEWSPVLHDSFHPDSRSPGGAVTPGTTVRLRLRVAQSDITSARVRVWDDLADTETWIPMAWDAAFDTDPVAYDWWFAEVAVGTSPTVLYYLFELTDDASGGACTGGGGQPDVDFYLDDDPSLAGGGPGAMEDVRDDLRSFQITVYDPLFDVPAWMQGGVVYQVFPDRFRNGDAANDPAPGGFVYGAGAIVRNGPALNPADDWNAAVCDPRGLVVPSCAGKWGDNFFGGDLAGLKQKIDDGYFDHLGVTALYLTPIFRAPSNHKYDTADYFAIDPAFGTLDDFRALAASAQAHGLELILDGVFNHTSSDSPYFDFYCRHDASGALVNPSASCSTGQDGSGACEATGSPYRPWYFFSDTDAIQTPGGGGADLCEKNPPGRTYEAWGGFGSLPKLRTGDPGVRDLIWSDGASSAAPFWTAEGAAGWRLDAAAEVDCGHTCDPADDFWEGFRDAVRDGGVTGRTDVLVLGEEWGDASPWLLGGEWDSVMNYRFRSALLGWMFTGCAGAGCALGARFEDGDSNSFSVLGPIEALSPSQLDGRLRSIAEDYPPAAHAAMMNLGGSHDTNRLLFLLEKINLDDGVAARERLKEWWSLAFAYPGAPTLYYGDEIGLAPGGVWDGAAWQDDPYNRAPFPWDDAAGSAYSPDTTDLLPHLRHVASVRHACRGLADGAVHHGLIVDDEGGVYGFGRTGSCRALIAANRSGMTQGATFTGLNAAPMSLADGTLLLDALNGGTYVVSGGQVSVPVDGRWTSVLVEQATLDAPAPVGGLDLHDDAGDIELSWRPLLVDLSGGREVAVTYEIHRGSSGSFAAGPTSLVASVQPPAFGSPGGRLTYEDPGAAGGAGEGLPWHYRVRALTAAGTFSDSPSITLEVCNAADDDGDGTVDDAPAPPGSIGESLRVARAGASGVRLTWSAGANAETYAVYRASVASGVSDPPNELGETAALEFTDAPPAATILYYAIAARDSCGGETP